MDCIFCKIINNEMESLKLYEDDIVIVILDAFPNSDGHTLIIPKNHYETFKDIPNDVLLHINFIAKKYTDILMNKLNKKSMTTSVNYGDRQIVKHYHMHLLPNLDEKPTKTKKEIYELLQ